MAINGWCNNKSASWGEKGTGPNPTDRSKSGTKRSLLVDGQGIPLGITVDGANRHDMKMTKATLSEYSAFQTTTIIIIIYRQIPNNKTSVLTRVMTILKYTSYLKNMVIPFMCAREEETIIMVTKKKKRRRKDTKI